MISLLLASILFLGIHVFVSGTPLRGVLVGAIGEKVYSGLFALASLGAIVWMSMAYGAAPYHEVWIPELWARHLTVILVFIGVMLVVLGLTTRNPTSAGQEGALSSDEPAQGIIRITRHPFLWGVVFWAAGHLMARGDLAAIVLFGTFLLLALIGPFLIDGKRARRDPAGWARFAAITSWLPFAAIVSRRTSLRLREIGWWRPLVGVAVYLVIVLWVHEWLFGVPVMAM